MKGVSNEPEFSCRICPVRINVEQREVLDEFMKKHNLSESDAIRFAIESLSRAPAREVRVTEKIEVDL